jgi:glycosyltransferase involved in cell wall biosynthesis
VPPWIRPALGDIRSLGLNRRMHRQANLVAGRSYGLIIQLHHRFQDVGKLIARRVGAPFVLRVDALEVREEEAWGIRRPGYGGAVERLGELRILRSADLVIPVSDVLDAELDHAGIGGKRRMVLANGVDVLMFSPGEADPELRRAHDLEGRFVVGWVGGFRPFHGLELVAAIARRLKERVPRAVLCLMGTGPLREWLVEETRPVQDVVRVLPAVPHEEVPRWLRTFDACLQLGNPEGFHYSPMKLYEYLACARPIIAADVGQVGQVLTNNEDALLVQPGDAGAAAAAIERLANQPRLRAALSTAARETAVQRASWDVRAEALIAGLRARRLLAGSEGVVERG